MDKTMSEAARFFNNVQKNELANFVALSAIFQSHGLETKELKEAFITYSKHINSLKEIVRKQLVQTVLVDETLANLKVKVKGDAKTR